MKIQENISSSTKQFGQLNGGDIFEFNRSLYIKLIKNITIDSEIAARLIDGIIKDFAYSAEVILRNDVKVVSG